MIMISSLMISSLMIMVDQGGKWWHFCFKTICGPVANSWGKCLILFETVLFIGEKWIIIFILLERGLLRQFCSRNSLQTGENTLQ